MPKKDWKESLGYNTVKAVPHAVNGTEQNFYPISVGMTFELKSLAKPIAKGLAGLFASDDKDTGSTSRDIRRTVGDGSENIIEHTNQAIDPKLAEVRMLQMSTAIESLFEALHQPGTQEVIAKLVMDSLKDVFERKDRPGEPISFDVTPRDFLSETPLPTMKDYVVGLFKANRQVLGPFGQAVEQKLNEATAKLDAKLKSPQVAPSPTNETMPPPTVEPKSANDAQPPSDG